MRFRVWLTIAASALFLGSAAGVAGCTQDFGQFEPQGGEGDCGGTEKLCGGACVSRLDPAYGCGDGCSPCDITNAIAVCSAGACAVDSCVSGFSDCDLDAANGCEADTSSDPQNCGACGAACAAANGTPTCVAKVCGLGPCTDGFDDCDGDPLTGCETPTATDPQNCGGCGAVCDLPNADEACQGSACAVGSCQGTYDDCDQDAQTGCETDVATSADHCGSCGNACPGAPNAIPVCSGAGCGLMCVGTYADCDLDPANGCEVDLASDPLHCGSCSRACDGTNVAALACAGGACTSTCVAGYGNCGQPAAPGADDGCEANLDTDVDHCGDCNRPCDANHVASLSCSGGVCDSSCDPMYGNCNRPAAGADDGCETNVTADNLNCGGCGNSCATQGGTNNSFDCTGGASGQQTCGCSAQNECNAGSSGICNSTSGICTCAAGACNVGEACGPGGACTCNGGLACAPGTACCATPAGCFNLQTDPQSCGACGRACPPGFACAAAACVCDAPEDCNAGTPGVFTCNAQGLCVCGGATCAAGERCQADGQCG